MMEVQLEQGSQTWLDWRAGHKVVDGNGTTFEAVEGGPRITATAASVVGGSNPFQKPHELWGEMVGLRKRQVATFPMQRGNALEPKARAAFCKYVGEEYEPVCVQSSLENWIAASLDGIDVLRTRGVEIKCPISQTTHDFAVAGEVPPYYYDQIQWQHMACDNLLEEIFYFSWAPQFGEAPPISVKPDLSRQHELLTGVKNFRIHVDTKVPLSGTDFEAAAKTFLVLNRRAKALKELLDEAKEKIKALSGGKPMQGGGVMVTVSKSNGTVDWQSTAKALAAQAGVSDEDLAALAESNRGKPSTTFAVKETVEADAIYEELKNLLKDGNQVSTPDLSPSIDGDSAAHETVAPVW